MMENHTSVQGWPMTKKHIQGNSMNLMFMMKNNRYSQTSFEEAGNAIQSNWQYYVSLFVRKFHKIDYAA
jgi:hypothetical protein